MEKKSKTLVLLDGNALIHRAYHALPPLTTKDGEVVNAAYGFVMTLLSVLEKFKPEYIIATFDLAGPTFRHDRYEEYKATRTKAPDDLYAQIPRVKELTRAFNIPIFEKEGFEADDCVGTLSRLAEKEGVETIIVTGDMDTLQLVTPMVKVFTMRRGIKDTVLYDEEGVLGKYGLKPSQIADYKGLSGDASDNIPGVKGIGPKTASDLLQKYQNLEGIFEALPELKENLREKLERDKEQAFLSRELGEIDTAVPIELDLPAAVAKEYDQEKVKALFKELGFFSLLKRLPGGEEASEKGSAPKKKKKKTKLRVLASKKEVEGFFAENLPKRIALFAEQETGSLFGAHIRSIEIAFGEESVSISWNDETKGALKEFLEDGSIEKIAYDAKALLHLFDKEGISLSGVTFDVLIAAYLLDSGGNMNLEYLALAELGEEELTAKALTVLLLEEKFRARLKEVSKEQESGRTLQDVFEKIEMPLIPVLFEMEKTGVYLNTEKFKELSDEMATELSQLEKDIYAFAGREFNINSPKQLAVVLFEDLKIPTENLKRTKTGVSTASTELQKLQEYPIVQKIEGYRELFKLKTTYLDTLPLMVDEHSRLHSNFRQTVAATGRLSSSDPNLQNIPARNAWSERIRGAFEPSEGFVFVGADYSQIELRVMAHMSGDESLVESYRLGEDVHRITAAAVFQVKPEEVTDDMRRKAKVFNFGIMYGMGTFGLAQAAKLDQKAAAQFIEEYFKKFSGVKRFIEELKESAREKHYVETELGRRRYIPEIESKNIQVARAAERMAINMPIQGMEADIVKLGMLAVEALIEQEFKGDVRTVLQVHDELIFEVRKGKEEAFSAKVKEAMEGVYPLKVPLIVEVFSGKNWGEI